MNKIKQLIDELKSRKSEADKMDEVNTKLGQLHHHYQLADLHTKQAILRTVFNSQLYYSEGCYRTPYILPAFALKAATLQEKKLLIIEQPSQNSDKILGCAPLHTPIEHLTPLLTLLKHIA